MPPLSPNFGERRGGLRPDLIVLHYTAMQSCEAALHRLCDPATEVSAHYLISEQGEIHALVPEEMRAWHAGAGSWRGVSDINSRSVGIELANDGASPFAAAQMQALEGLLAAVLARWAIPAAGVIGHSDMAPGRKADPGARFDWRRLALNGYSVWPEAGVGAGDAGDPADFVADAKRFGYPEGAEPVLLAAFRLRFRPWAKGPADKVDAALIHDLAQRFGTADRS